MKNEAGTIASESVRENDAMVRNTMDIVSVMTKLNKKVKMPQALVLGLT